MIFTRILDGIRFEIEVRSAGSIYKIEGTEVTLEVFMAALRVVEISILQRSNP